MDSFMDQCVQSTLVWSIEQVLAKDFLEKYVIRTSFVNIVMVILVTFWRVTHCIPINVENFELRFDGAIVDGINLTTIGIEN